MSFPINDNELEQALAEAFAPPLVANFDAWQKQHSDALAYLNPQQNKTMSIRRKLMSRTVIFAAAAIVLLCVWLGLSEFGAHGPGSGAFAQVLEQIEKAKTVAWKQTIYDRITSKDGKRTWLKPKTLQWTYKSPGLYREVGMGEEGQIKYIEITDATCKPQKQMIIHPAEKEALLYELTIDERNPLGPFEWVKNELKENNLQWVEKRKTATGEVNVFRHSLRDNANGRNWSYDFWIDQKTKRLVEVHVPGADIFDPETEIDRNNPPEKEWSIGTCPGRVESEIVFDVDLDNSLFRLEPPADYSVQTKDRPQVTEKEMIDYLGIVADYNDKTFPDQVFPYIFSSDRLNKIWDKPEKERTPAEQKLLDTNDHYKMAGLNLLPIGHCVEDHTIKDSFRYLGKGVKLGDKDRIVCWYKLKDAKDTKTYRVVYGDLSVKDVAPEDLPLPLEP
ncbi:MAG: hypothetical protein ABSG67_14265 [Thermoguttaceae bacterium]